MPTYFGCHVASEACADDQWYFFVESTGNVHSSITPRHIFKRFISNPLDRIPVRKTNANESQYIKTSTIECSVCLAQDEIAGLHIRQPVSGSRLQE